MPICNNCNDEFPLYIKIDGKVRNLCKRKYCLSCSPFGKHNTRSIGQILQSECGICKKKLEDNRRTRCNYCSVKLRRARIKLAAINLLGGKCVACGWDKDPWVLQFHHKDDNKEFGLSEKMNISWEKMKKEALKCELLCANCHAMKHCSKNEKSFIEALMDYDGDLDLGKFGSLDWNKNVK